MRTIDAIRRSAVSIAADQTVKDAAEIMESAGVGALGIVDGTKLIGLVTDRDIVRRAMAAGMPLDARVDSVMTSPAVSISFDADLHDAFALFRSHAIRRLAVVKGEEFVGMITIDDLLIDLAGDLADLARPVTAEALFAHHDGAVPAVI